MIHIFALILVGELEIEGALYAVRAQLFPSFA